MRTLPKEKNRGQGLLETYKLVRKGTETICSPLQIEDYVVQPIGDVSPPKWHLGHTTWFFETFVLAPNLVGYKMYDSNFNYVFNSYYETVGARVIRTDRGNLSRPTVSEIYRYRKYVNDHVEQLFENTDIDKELQDILELGIHHEQQHQELLFMDIKYILGHNPLFPAYSNETVLDEMEVLREEPVTFSEGAYWIGHKGKSFCYDNEKGRHLVYLDAFEIASHPVSNGAYLEFIRDGGYTDFRFWHAAGWDWVNRNKIKAPLYWHFMDGHWMQYGLRGIQEIIPTEAVCHISYYEAAAFAAWSGKRLPTETEWEVASGRISWGHRWEWTESAYLPYPKFRKAKGAIGEYNGKFMVDQIVLRGASVATPEGHSRKTYRNFFPTDRRWQFSGMRLVQ
ncbi:ergothioneine biosynthesis protein EgtB [Sinomicrobium oceani]|uniref:Ergothioneine biosynthesis protein EgtB n=1 Tax=Sinomicrobium oceani TaxID=1150368 RepID=A0A1K1Q5T2_9FLAO|nr:ergothioneine biosynthesis protein EgtB [Sinomicrobium oceani]SFW55049.1 ergothioneine biosynthesis protein EgtB [Sinomicrobium oceani]